MYLKKTVEILCNVVVHTYRYIVVFLFAAISVWLFLMSGFSTSYISADASEHTYFVKDQMWKNLLAALIVVLLLVLLPYLISAGAKSSEKVRKLLDRIAIRTISFEKCRRWLLLFAFVGGVVWVVSSQYVPGADQYSIMNAAAGLRTKDYSMFTTGGYIQKYPNQLGIVVVLYLLSFVFGNYNYILFQLLNVVGLVVIYRQLSEISGIFGLQKKGQLVVILVGILFLPLGMYVSFVYGTILGLALSFVAMKHELLFFENYRWKSLIISVLAITGAVILKSNYLIFMLGMILLALIEILRQKKLRIVILPVAVILLYLAQSFAMTGFVEYKTGEKLLNGMSSWSWVAMGLQSNEVLCDGWYNGYNELSYKENGGSSLAQAQEAKLSIKQSLAKFRQDPEAAVKFFAKKTASQWNNPTFESFWILQVRQSNIQTSAWLTDMVSVTNSDSIAGYLNTLQFLLLFGVLSFIILCGLVGDLRVTLLQVIFIGGFLFHFVWEAKCQYTLPYFVLMLPFAVAGYCTLVGKIRRLPDQLKICVTNHKLQKPTIRGVASLIAVVGPLLVFIMGAGVFRSQYMKDLVFPENNTAEYQLYVNNHTIEKVLDDGTYVICTQKDPKLLLSIKDAKAVTTSDVVLSRTDDSASTKLKISTYDRITRFQFVSSGLFLDLINNYEVDNQKVQAFVRSTTAAQEWHLKKIDGASGFYILIGNESALTYNVIDNSVFIKKFTGSDDQKWNVNE